MWRFVPRRWWAKSNYAVGSDPTPTASAWTLIDSREQRRIKHQRNRIGARVWLHLDGEERTTGVLLSTAGIGVVIRVDAKTGVHTLNLQRRPKALAYEPGGRGFKSCRAPVIPRDCIMRPLVHLAGSSNDNAGC